MKLIFQSQQHPERNGESNIIEVRMRYEGSLGLTSHAIPTIIAIRIAFVHNAIGSPAAMSNSRHANEQRVM